MNHFLDLIPYIITLSIAALIPGPGMLGLLFKTLTHHYKNALFMLLGLITGDLIYLTIALSGLSFISPYIDHRMSQILMMLACAYLFYIAWKLWHFQALSLNAELPIDQANKKSTTSKKAFRSDYFIGLAITLSNPKTITFYLALLPSIFGTSFLLNRSFIVILSLSTVLTLALVGALYIFSAVKIKALFDRPKFQTYLMKAMAIAMSIMGVFLIYLQVFNTQS